MHTEYVVLGAVLMFFAGIIAKTVYDSIKSKNYKKVPEPIAPPTGDGGGHGKGDGKGGDKPAV